MTKLSNGYVQTLEHLEQDKVSEAMAVYRRDCLASVKKLYAESAKVYPLRFSKAKTWCVWTKRLYILSMQTDRLLAKKDAKAANQKLIELRIHFHQLHEETGRRLSNDWIYAFYQELHREDCSIAKLKQLQEALNQADLSLKAKAKEDDYKKVCQNWNVGVKPLLEQDTLDKAQRQDLVKQTKSFYYAYGIAFE